MSKSGIYEAKGKAREYCRLALNVYDGCPHKCVYCYASAVAHKNPEEFPAQARPRIELADIIRSAANFNPGRGDTVLLSFLCDPYPPEEAENRLTREAIKILHHYGYRVSILTKAGSLACRDIDLLNREDAFGVTLTTLQEKDRQLWEPGAGTVDERLQNLYLARENGIRTWVSLEPVMRPMDTLAVIAGTARYVDHYKVGKLNYQAPLEPVNWAHFAADAVATLRRHGAGFYIKQDLGAFIGYPDGIREGVQVP